MKWYDLIDGEENCLPDFFMADELDFFGRDWSDLAHGRVIADWDARSLLRSSKPENDGEPDDMLASCVGFPVFSRRLREALARANVGVRDIQYLSIHVLRSTGEELPGFAAANVTTRVPALDREHSTLLEVHEDEVDPLTGMPKVASFWTAALRKEHLSGHDVIRLAEFFPSVFVSEKFVRVFQESGFTGATFKPVPVY
jgi:hypothetical protein